MNTLTYEEVLVYRKSDRDLQDIIKGNVLKTEAVLREILREQAKLKSEISE